MEQKKGRQLMPLTAEMVDELRALLGAEWVDAAIKAGVQARREYLRLEQEQGKPAADAWLAAQTFPKGAFWAQEGQHTVGMLPPRPAAASRPRHAPAPRRWSAR